MRKLFLIALFSSLSVSALAQQPVHQSGNVTPNTVPAWYTNGVIGGGVTSGDSPISSFGVTNNGGQAICVNSDRITAAGRNTLCLTASTANTPAQLIVQNYGSAAPLGFQFVIDGTTIVPGGGIAGITFGSTTTSGGTANCLAYNVSSVLQCLATANNSILATNSSGVPAYATALPNGVTATTQTPGSDNTTKVATDAFVQSAIVASSLACSNLPAGVDCNTLNAQTSAYAAVSSDCGKTITLGGSAFYTLTVGAASGFSSTCSIVIANIDTGRGKTIAVNGVTFPNNNILWPQQAFILKNENNSWQLISKPARWKLLGNTQFEVNSGGSNSNDGLATGTANAFQTIQGAIGVIANAVDANGFQVKLHLNCSGGVTYTGQVRLVPIVGQPIGNNPSAALNPILSGDTTTPSNCILTSASGATIQAIGGTYWNIEGMELKNTDGSSPCVLVDQQSWIRAGVMQFDSCNGSNGNHIVVENLSGYEATANYTISAGASSHVYTTLKGEFVYAGGTITLSGTPAFAYAFAATERNSLQLWSGATFSGSATGARYNASLGGGIETSGSGATFLPGNSSGTATNPGWYN